MHQKQGLGQDVASVRLTEDFITRAVGVFMYGTLNTEQPLTRSLLFSEVAVRIGV